MSEILILTKEEVSQILTMDMAVRGVESAYRQKSEKKAELFPLVTHVFEGKHADMDIKSGYLAGDGIYGFKLVSWFEDNDEKGIPRLSATIMIFDDQTGQPIAMMNAGTVTGMRTGAAGAVGVKYLANPDAHTMLIVGTGVQAYYQLAAVLTVTDKIDIVYIYSPHGVENAARKCPMIREEAERLLGGKERHFDLIPVDNLQEAVGKSEIIITVTNSKKPLIQADWVQPGTHFSCIGSDMAGKQEINGAILKKAKVFVDDLNQTKTVGECEVPIKEGIITEDDIDGEIGDIIAGKTAGRTAAADITVFDSSGISLQDLVVAGEIVDYAKKNGTGRWITL